MAQNKTAKKVVMAVNNPATTDYRVVKSAEMVANAGYECHVVGILKPGYERFEEINGVTYHRVEMKLGLMSLLAGYFPRLVTAIPSFKTKSKLSYCSTKLEPFRNSSSLFFIKRFLRLTLFFIKRFLRLTLISTPLMALIILLQILAGCVILLVSGVLLLVSPFLIFFSVILGLKRVAQSKTVDVLQNAILPLKLVKLALDLTIRTFYSGSTLIPSGKTLILRHLVLILRHLVNVFPLVKKSLLSKKPQIQPLGVFLLQGRYLTSFYRKLIDLDGDIYHAHELWMLESCALAAGKQGAKLIYDSHELELHRNNAWPEKSNSVRCDYERRYINQADAVFAVSNGCSKEIAKVYGLAEVSVLRNTPMSSHLVDSSESLREDFGVNDSSKLLIYTGSVTINRGLELILHGLRQLPEYELVTVGPWNKALKKELEALATELKVEDRFHMHPKVPPGELISLISQGDISVIPIQDVCLSYRYCLPNKLFEAAFAGLPVVASDLPDMREFIFENNLGVVFENGSVDSLVQTLNTIEKTVHFNKIRENRKKIINKYCFEKEVEVLLTVYRSLGCAPKVLMGAKAV